MIAQENMDMDVKAGGQTKPIIRQLRVLAMALGLWVIIVLLFASQFVIVGSFTWQDAFLHAGFFWLPWAFFMPAVMWVSFRFPIERNRVYLNIGVHVLACVIVVAASQFAFRNFMPRVPPPPGESIRNRPPRPPASRGEERPNGFGGLRAGLDILVYWSLLSACQTIINFRKSQERERREAELEARLARSKLQSLRMQINPHFLFNTLNAISTLVYVNPRAADEMIGDLSELLRNSLDSANEQEITLARELGFIRHYVGIEKKRFGERLQTEEKVAPELMNALVPALILQPLVENAIRHGIEPRRAPGLVTIEVRLDGKSLVLRVSDNGRGLVEDANRKATRQGIGLANTRARLQELYGPEQSLSFGKGEPSGCVVEIRLPYHAEPAVCAGALAQAQLS